MEERIFQTSLNGLKKQNKKALAVLVDPDKAPVGDLTDFADLCARCAVDFVFVGGSLLTQPEIAAHIQLFSAATGSPVVIFPGSTLQVDSSADAILLLSLISGRNADLLIGKHVEAAPHLRKSGLEVVPTGYLLVDGGKPTTASYISNSAPIPADKPEIAVSTALAGEMLGLKTIFLDSGSGAIQPVPEEMISRVSSELQVPLIVGGGVRSPELAYTAASAGADLLVVGNAFEQDPGLLPEMMAATRAASTATKVKN